MLWGGLNLRKLSSDASSSVALASEDPAARGLLNPLDVIG